MLISRKGRKLDSRIALVERTAHAHIDVKRVLVRASRNADSSSELVHSYSPGSPELALRAAEG